MRTELTLDRTNRFKPIVIKEYPIYQKRRAGTVTLRNAVIEDGRISGEIIEELGNETAPPRRMQKVNWHANGEYPAAYLTGTNIYVIKETDNV